MSTENPTHDDLHDRLLDLALRETLGGETPPDLSKPILSEASQQTEKLSTLAIGDEAMNANHEKSRKTRKLWISLAVAASLLVAAGLMFLEGDRQTSKKLARTQARATTANKSEESKPAKSTIELPKFESISAGTIVSVPDDVATLLGDIKIGDKYDSLMRTAPPRTIANEKEQQRPAVRVHPVADLVIPVEELGTIGVPGVIVESDGTVLFRYIKRLSEAKNKDELMMAVTPHIIIQEGEEERLGFMPEWNMGLGGLINDAYAGSPRQKGDSGLPKRLARGEVVAKAAEALSLGIDPMIVNFQDEKYAIAQQLRQQQLTRRGGRSSLEIVKL